MDRAAGLALIVAALTAGDIAHAETADLIIPADRIGLAVPAYPIVDFAAKRSDDLPLKSRMLMRLATHTNTQSPDLGDLVKSVPPARAQKQSPVRASFPQPPRPKPRPKNMIELAGAKFTARLAAEAEPLQGGIAWRVTALDSKALAVDSAYARPAIELEPGQYRVNAKVGLVTAEAEFTVAPDETTEIDLVFNAGRLQGSVSPGGATMPLDNALLQIRRLGSSQTEPLLTEIGGRIDTVLPIGEFEFEARLGLTVAKTSVVIEAGQATAVDLVLEVGFVLADAHAAEGTEPLSGATFILAAPNSPPGDVHEIARTSGRHAMFSVGPGDYRLITRFGLAEVEETIRVAANQLTTVAVTLNAARLELAAVGPPFQGLAIDPVIFRVHADASENSTGSEQPRLVTEVSGPQSVLRLPAGRFVVEAERMGHVTRETVELRAGESRSLRLVLDAGRLNLMTNTGAGLAGHSAVRVRATPIGANGAAIGTAIDLGLVSSAPFDLPAGHYRIDGILEPGGAVASTDAVVEADNLAQAQLDFKVGTARLEMLDKPDGTAITDALWRLRTIGDRRKALIIGGAVEVELAPGTYNVKAEAGEKGASGNLTVEAGKLATITLVAE